MEQCNRTPFLQIFNPRLNLSLMIFIRTVKSTLLKKSPFGRKPKTCFSRLRDKLFNILDRENLERDKLTPEQMRESSDTRKRLTEEKRAEMCDLYLDDDHRNLKDVGKSGFGSQ